MSIPIETAALVALLRAGVRSPTEYANLVDEHASAVTVLESDLGLLAQPELERAATEVAAWEARGLRVLTVLDREYPDNLRGIHDRPPLVFVAGVLQPGDARAVAVIGTRTPSPGGLARAHAIAEHLVEAGYTVASGLAAGIDTAAHTAALARGGRTVAVIGTGVLRCYPPQNRDLQRRIASKCAVVSQFWPDSTPSRRTFPMRNAVMSGLALGTVVIEASHTSGSRIQARLAVAHGRPVFLHESLLEQRWAREFAGRPGTHVVRSPDHVVTTVERLTSAGPLVA